METQDGNTIPTARFIIKNFLRGECDLVPRCEGINMRSADLAWLQADITCARVRRLSDIERLRAAALGVVVAALVSVGLATPASAALTLCNKTSYMLASAVGFQAKGRWVTRGWFTLEPGQCTAALEYALSDGSYYTYAYTLPVHVGTVKTFAGNQKFCTAPGQGEFTISGQEDCERRGFTPRPFARVLVEGKTDWTTTFTEPDDYSMERARVAGVQRLLSDIGASSGKIDGYFGERTRRALIGFKREHKMPADLTTPSLLYQALVLEARTTQQNTGYKFCNETAETAWAAIGYGEGPAIVSTGWFKVAPHACTEAIKDRLKEKSYFTFAETEKGTGRGLLWGGEHSFCTMETRFTIKGANDCEKRGYLSTGFRKIDVGKEAGFTQTLSAENSTADRGTLQ